MTVRDQFLELELRLLLLKHGKSRVLKALRKIDNDPTIQQLTTDIKKASEPLEVKTQKATKVQLHEVCIGSDYDNPLFHKILSAFARRTFLPSLRDVNRFFEKLGVESKKIRSRNDAVPLLMNLLVSLTPSEVEKIATASQQPENSDLSILAQAIMGRGSTNAG
jgi:hypothetical protein